jgi:hypothetical protein
LAEFVINDFSGGLNLTPPVDLPQQNECILAENVYLEETGAVGSDGTRNRQNVLTYNGGADIHSIVLSNIRNLVGSGTKVFTGELDALTELTISSQSNETKNPTSASGTNWTNPSFALQSDDNRAAYNTTTQDYLILNGFGFSLPSGATIDGFEAFIEGNGASATTAERQITVALSSDGFGKTSSDKTVTLDQNTDSTQTAGSSSDVWGGSWTAAQVESSNFSIIIHDANTTAANLRIDQVQLRVYYTFPANISNANEDIITWVETPDDRVVFEAGGRPFFVTSSGNAEILENEAPGSAPTVATGAAGNLTGSYTYRVTFSTADNKETLAGDASSTVSPSAEAVDLTAIPTSDDSKHTKRFIYRTGGTLPVYYQVAEIPDNTTTTLTDDKTDAAVLTTGILLLSDNNSILFHSDNVKYPEMFFDRLFWIDQDNPNRIIWSKPLNPFAYPSSNFIDFPSPNVYRIVRFLDELIIFADNTVYKLSGNSEENFRVERTLSPIGTRWPLTVQKMKDRIAYFNDNGFFFFDGLTSRPMTNRLDTLFDGITKAGNKPFNKTLSVAQKFQGVIVGDVYYLAYAESDQTENNRVLVIDQENGQIHMIAYGALSIAADLSSNQLYMGDTSGFIYELLTGTTNDGGTATFTFQSKFYDPAPGFNKHFKAITLDIETNGQSITPVVEFDSGNSSETLSSLSTSGRASKILKLSSAAARKARNISIKLSDTVQNSKTSTGEPAVRLLKLIGTYEPLPQRLRIG